jgi:hypothetical protein
MGSTEYVPMRMLMREVFGIAEFIEQGVHVVHLWTGGRERD